MRSDHDVHTTSTRRWTRRLTRRRGDVVGSRQKEDYTTLKNAVCRLFPWRRPDIEATPNYLEGNNLCIQSMMNDPKRGRGQGHLTYFWNNGTDTRVPQNVFLVQPIFTKFGKNLSGLNRKNWLGWGRNPKMPSPILAPKTKIFGARIGISSQICKKFKLSSSKLYIGLA